MKARVTAALASVLTVGALSGCTFLTAQQTLIPYNPSDGVSTQVGGLMVRNAMLVTGTGTRATLVASVYNPTSTAQTLRIQYNSAGGAKQNVTVPVGAGASVQISTVDGNRVVLDGIDAKPGSLAPLYLTDGSTAGNGLSVPVLDGTLSEYAGLVPGPAPTPAPTPAPPAPSPPPTATPPAAPSVPPAAPGPSPTPTR